MPRRVRFPAHLRSLHLGDGIGGRGEEHLEADPASRIVESDRLADLIDLVRRDGTHGAHGAYIGFEVLD